MATKTRTTTDDDIRAAITSQGFADCSVVRQFVKSRFENLDCDGTWYCLFVIFKDGLPPVLWGRRRTMQELLQLAKRGPIL